LPTHIWYIFCPIHDFQADSIKKSIVMTKVKAHIRKTGCGEVCCDDIKRHVAPNDTEMYPVKAPRRELEEAL